MPNAGLATEVFSDPVVQSKQAKEKSDAVIMKYAPLIKYIATRIAARLPMHIEIQDLINSGVLGLMDAIEKFDPEKAAMGGTFWFTENREKIASDETGAGLRPGKEKIVLDVLLPVITSDLKNKKYNLTLKNK